MIKKTIKYVDFNDEEVEEDFYFHLSKAELVELEMSHEGGLSEALQRIIKSNDQKQIMAEFKNLILTAYGRRSENGKGFTKNQQLRDEFAGTEAYSALFMELITDTDAAVVFINGLLPADLQAEAQRIAAEEASLREKNDQNDQEVKVITKADLEEMSQEELEQAGQEVEAGTARYEHETL